MKKFVASLKWWLLVLGIPVLAWCLARFFVDSPRLVAPFLFVSPAIAFGIASQLIFPKNKAKEFAAKRTDVATPPSIAALAEECAKRAGITKYQLHVTEADSSDRGATTAGVDDIWVRIGKWDRLSDPERQFAMYGALAHMYMYRTRSGLTTVAFAVLAFLGCVAGMVNLWLIIPAQAIFASTLLYRMVAWMRTHEVRSDALALEWSRDYEAGVTYITATANDFGNGMFPGKSARLELLRKEAKRLGLVA